MLTHSEVWQVWQRGKDSQDSAESFKIVFELLSHFIFSKEREREKEGVVMLSFFEKPLFEKPFYTLHSFLQDEKGEDVVEYVVIFALVSIILLASINILSEQIDSLAAVIVAGW